jgi:nucleotide-binding universal stress UspA family protein
MAVAVSRHRRRLLVLRGYRRLLVPVIANAESARAVQVACDLAAEHHASITALTVLEVPPLLPFDTHMVEAEDEAQRLLEAVGATGDAYGVNVSPKRVRARDVGAAIVENAATKGIELIVIGAARRRLRRSRAVAFGSTVEHVLQGAPCRVMVIAPPDAEPRQIRATLQAADP